jgi:lysyl-tRNA synthetase, class II
MWSGPIDAISVVRANQPLLGSLLRVPLSLLVPAPGLPVWGAVLQVAVIGSLGEIVLGRRRFVGLALATQYIATMAGRVAAWIGHGHPYGLRPAAAFVRDTGPSAAVVAIGVAVAVLIGARRTAAVVITLLLVEIVGLHTLAGREHLAAIVVGLMVGVWWQLERRGGAAHVAGAVFGLLGCIVLTGVLDGTPVAAVQRIAMAFGPLMPDRPTRLACATIGGLLLLIAASLRRGQRSAWWIAAATSALAIVAPINARGARGASVLAVVVLTILVTGRRWFPAATNRRSHRRIAVTVAAFVAVVVTTQLLPSRVDRALAPTLTLGSIAAIALLGWWITRPRTPVTVHDLAFHRARRIVEQYGSGPLDYFALRDDKHWFFAADSVVAYALKGSVALVSPDPIGPHHQRSTVWAEFESYAAGNGWTVSVLAAGADWLDTYHEADLRSVYVGDLAIVEPATFRLDGGDRKGLRQAVNRVDRSGYTVTFHDSRHLDGDTRDAIEKLSASGRRGEAERGFSMTLSRMFDARDLPLLLAISRGPDCRVVAFCQFVPQVGGGWSLDVMRSERHGHPNGLLDHVIVETIRHLAALGCSHLCLNFATMRDTLAEPSPNRSQRLLRRLLQRSGRSLQIESLWKFNAKFGPIWQPLYVVFPAVADLPATTLAIARAESIAELPIVGRLFRQRTPIEGRRAA